MRNIKLVLDDKDFKQLEKFKEELQDKKGERVSWETYFLHETGLVS